MHFHVFIHWHPLYPDLAVPDQLGSKAYRLPHRGPCEAHAPRGKKGVGRGPMGPSIISYRIVHQGTKGFSWFFLTENLFDGGCWILDHVSRQGHVYPWCGPILHLRNKHQALWSLSVPPLPPTHAVRALGCVDDQTHDINWLEIDWLITFTYFHNVWGSARSFWILGGQESILQSMFWHVFGMSHLAPNLSIVSISSNPSNIKPITFVIFHQHWHIHAIPLVTRSQQQLTQANGFPATHWRPVRDQHSQNG